MISEKTRAHRERNYFPERIVMCPMSGCWLWTQCVNKDGYGVAKHPRRRGVLTAHRRSYEYYVGPLSPEQYVCHRCDTPSCVNPAHLFVGDARTNAHDAVRKGRHLRGERCGRTRLTEVQAKAIIAASPATRDELKHIADSFNAPVMAVAKVARGETWRWLRRPNG